MLRRVSQSNLLFKKYLVFNKNQQTLKSNNRSVMLVAAGLPLFGFIAALCGNRFYGFVSICVAGMFGMTAILLGFFFTTQYFVSLKW